MASEDLPQSKVHWFWKSLIGFFAILLGVLLFGLIRETITRNKYHALYPVPGKLITINDHDIHLNCVGEGSPTVVFESDFDEYGSMGWNSVQGAIGKITRACSYDRAGILWSEQGQRPRDGETIAAELKEVLDQAGEEGPFILVGHAFGGALLRIFAGQNLDDVGGMVLLESSHPEMFIRMEEYGINQEIPDKRVRPLIHLLSSIGSPGRFKGNVYDLPLDIYDPIQAFLPEASVARFDERIEGQNSLSQAREYQYLGDFPLIVFVSAIPSSPLEDPGQVLHHLWIELQHELLLLSRNSEIWVYEIGHYPQIQSPDLVIEAIKDVIDKYTLSIN